MRRATAILLLLLAVALTPSPAAPQTRVPSIADVPDSIARLLKDRGDAYVQKDRAKLAATLVGGPFAERELRSLDNAQRIDFAAYSFHASTQFSANFASARVKALYPERDVTAYHVIEEQQIAGFEMEPYTEDSFYTFIRSGPDGADRYDGWRLTSTTDFDVLAAFSARHMWDHGPVVAVPAEHFLLLVHPDQVTATSSALPIAEQAYADAQAFWPRRVDARYVLIAPSTTAELGDLLQATVDLSKFVAFTAGSVSRERGYEPKGTRVYVQLSHFGNYDAAGQRSVLVHELLHAFTRPLAGPFMPTWVEEGLAMYGSEGENGLAAAKRGATPAVFPSDEEYFVGPTREIVTRYSQAQIAIGTLVARFGKEGVVAFYEALGRARVAAGTDEFHVDRAVRESLRWSVDEWTRAWASRLR